MTTQEQDQTQSAASFGMTEEDLDRAMGPVVEQIRRMAQEEGRDVEEFFLSLDDELFGTLAVGHLAATRDGHIGAQLRRAALSNTAHLLERAGRADLIPLAAALGRYAG